MTGCCARATYDKFFDERQARKDAKHYRRKGLDPAARWMVGVARDQGIEGASALEAGGGVGAIQIELLKSGAASSTIVEMSGGYDDEASLLAREAGVEQRIQRRIGNFSSTEVAPADIVVLHRVVCCYPDYAELLGAAAGRTRRLLVFTHPPGNIVGRLFVAVANAWMRLTAQHAPRLRPSAGRAGRRRPSSRARARRPADARFLARPGLRPKIGPSGV